MCLAPQLPETQPTGIMNNEFWEFVRLFFLASMFVL